MPQREYVFIELDRPPRPGHTILQQLTAETDASGPRLFARTMDEQEADERRADDRYVCDAPSVPVELIRPVGDDSGGDAAPNVWGLDAVAATASPYRGREVTVAVLDSGIDLEHDAFRGMRDRITFKDFVGPRGEDSGAGPLDADPGGHGTHCAGTIFGQDVDGVRIGVAPDLERAYVGRVFDEHGSASSISLFRAIQWAVMERASVLSMSLSIDYPGMVERQVRDGVPLKLAVAQSLRDFLSNLRVFDTLAKLARDMVRITGGTLIVAAAGNHSVPAFRIPVAPPASADGVISVGAAGPSAAGWTVADFSNLGPVLCGPGVDVLSAAALHAATERKLRTKSGTSMAAPHVAGVAAQWFEYLRAEDQQSLSSIVSSQLIRGASKQFKPGTPPRVRGAGMVQAPPP